MYDSPQVREENLLRSSIAQTSLSCSKARYYNPSIGRFVSEDPIRMQVAYLGSPMGFQKAMTFPGFIPLYTYVRNHAIYLRDPLGLAEAGDIAGTGLEILNNPEYTPEIITDAIIQDKMDQNCELAKQACDEAIRNCQENHTKYCNVDSENAESGSIGVNSMDCSPFKFSSCYNAFAVCAANDARKIIGDYVDYFKNLL